MVLTSLSRGTSLNLISAFAVDPLPHVVKPIRLSGRAVPTINLNIEPRWLPPPDVITPLCCVVLTLHEHGRP